ncbi:Hypothetical predicted protein [Octopus vulgaris]|uniref:Uncharacterized protein n=1 Tax=Octopus vulgaris TaxID=6645 RepID=A0AA36EVF9_OCTVU|nr:Hypothetical predicted protein [Octopus vulgaris]
MPNAEEEEEEEEKEERKKRSRSRGGGSGGEEEVEEDEERSEVGKQQKHFQDKLNIVQRLLLTISLHQLRIAEM